MKAASLLVVLGLLCSSCVPPPPKIKPLNPSLIGSQEVMYICPETAGLRFAKAELDRAGEMYHVPVCQDGKFLGKLSETPQFIRVLDGSRHWNMDVRLKKSLRITGDHRGFHTLQRGQDFVRARLTPEIRDVQGRPLRLAQ